MGRDLGMRKGFGKGFGNELTGQNCDVRVGCNRLQRKAFAKADAQPKSEM